MKLKEYACIQVNHHKEVPKAIADMQNLGWRLHTYQTTGYGTDVKHYLLFEKGDQPPPAIDHIRSSLNITCLSPSIHAATFFSLDHARSIER